MFALTRRLFRRRGRILRGFGAQSLSPVLGLTDASWILPDAPLLPALLACAYALCAVFFDPMNVARRACGCLPAFTPG